MFYCDDCAKLNEWPVGFFKSKGKCEVCSTPSVICSDVPSAVLPIPKRYRK